MTLQSINLFVEKSAEIIYTVTEPYFLVRITDKNCHKPGMKKNPEMSGK